MPFCPNCRYEYQAHVWMCPDCNERLVPSLDGATEDAVDEGNEEDAHEDWVPLARLASPEFAELVAGGLEALDIPVVVYSGTGHFGHTGQMGATAFRAVGGGYTIAVPRNHVVRADQEAELMLGEGGQNHLLPARLPNLFRFDPP